MAAKVVIRGNEQVQAKLNQVAKDLQGEPLEKAMKDATLVVTRQAKIYSPVDTGRLRASITPEVVRRDTVVQGIVGSNVFYAPFQEEKKKYLYRALVENAGQIYRILKDAVAGIVRK